MILVVLMGRVVKRMSEIFNKEVKIIYRLLEMGFLIDDDLIFFKDEEDLINLDVIIVDEVLMVDIILMYNLFRVIKLGIRVILVGDSD